MEGLQDALFFDAVPASWQKRAYPSMYLLGQWYSDLLLRIKELEIWTGDFQLPAAVWLGGLRVNSNYASIVHKSYSCRP